MISIKTIFDFLTGAHFRLGILGAVLGAGISYLGARSASKRSASAIRDAAAMSEFKPYNVYSGFGSGVFDTEPATTTTANRMVGGQYRYGAPGGMLGRTLLSTLVNKPGAPRATARLSPEYQAVRDAYLDMASKQRGAITGYMPEEAARNLYDKMASLSARDEEQARAELESRLVNQGMLGSTGGGMQMNAFYDALNDARLKRELAAYGMSQDDLDRMIAREMGLVQGATKLDALPLQNLELGGVFGGAQSRGGAFGAELIANNAMDRGDASSAFWANLGNKIGPAFEEWVKKPPTSQYTGMMGGGAYDWSRYG